MAQRLVAVGSIAPEIRLVRGVPPVNNERPGRSHYVTMIIDENGNVSDYEPVAQKPFVTLSEQRVSGHVVVYFMRSFY